jgi:hypothetical protein
MRARLTPPRTMVRVTMRGKIAPMPRLWLPRIGALVLSLVGACGSDARSTSSSSGSSSEPPPPPQTEAERAGAEVRDAQARVEQLQRDLVTFDARLNVAVNAVIDAQTDAARADGKERLERLRRDRAQLDLQLAQAKRAVCVADPTLDCK